MAYLTSLNGKISDTETRIARLDASTNSIQTVNYRHHEIHSGSHYFASGFDTGLGNGDTVEFVFTTPNTTTWIHMLFNFTFALGGNMIVYEGASGITGGTTLTPVNNNRNSTNTSASTVVKDPTSITSDGTPIAAYQAGANKSSGFAAQNEEIVLKQNEIYLFRFTSTATGNSLSYTGEWYEHTDKD